MIKKGYSSSSTVALQSKLTYRLTNAFCLIRYSLPKRKKKERKKRKEKEKGNGKGKGKIKTNSSKIGLRQGFLLVFPGE